MSWPLHDLVLRTPDLELRGLTEDLAHDLAAVVPDDLETDPRLPHLSPALDVLQVYWRNNGLWTRDDWVCAFAVLHDGVPVGLQGLEGKGFATRWVVDSHSWLVASARGRGLGKQMRAAVLELAFGHLGARTAVTEAWADNAASLGVSRALGYVDNGYDVHDGPRVMQRLVLTSWRSPVPVTWCAAGSWSRHAVGQQAGHGLAPGGDPVPHVRAQELQVPADADRARSLAVHAPVVDGRHRHAEVGGDGVDAQQRLQTAHGDVGGLHDHQVRPGFQALPRISMRSRAGTARCRSNDSPRRVYGRFVTV